MRGFSNFIVESLGNGNRRVSNPDVARVCAELISDRSAPIHERYQWQILIEIMENLENRSKANLINVMLEKANNKLNSHILNNMASNGYLGFLTNQDIKPYLNYKSNITTPSVRLDVNGIFRNNGIYKVKVECPLTDDICNSAIRHQMGVEQYIKSLDGLKQEYLNKDELKVLRVSNSNDMYNNNQIAWSSQPKFFADKAAERLSKSKKILNADGYFYDFEHYVFLSKD